MAEKEELLLNNIKIPEEDTKTEMALPPESKGGQTKKTHRLFSMPLFKESLHSNRSGLAIVSIGNALIMIIIIGILSTLHINSTADALKDLFENADMENTIKSGAISSYSAYLETAKGYQSFVDSKGQVQELVTTCMDEVEDQTLISGINTAKRGYDVAYAIAGINATTDEQKKQAHESAKKTTMTLVSSSLNQDSSLTDIQKAVATEAISQYLDFYFEDKNVSTDAVLKKILPSVLSDEVQKELSISDKEKEQVKNIFADSIKRRYTDQEEKEDVAISESFEMIPLLASEDQKEVAENVVSSLKEAYNKDPDSYKKDDKISNEIISEEVAGYVMDTMEDIAYYQYLPDFTVNYKTNDFGYPIQLVKTGDYAENGNPIYEEVPIKSYNPSLYIKVDDKMGTTSNMLEKMHKEVITGEDYTEEEYAEAKETCKDDIKQIRDNLNIFMKDYLSSQDKKDDIYYDSTANTVKEDAIYERAVNEVLKMAEVQLIDTYNDKNDVKVSTIEEITAENSSMSGKEALTLVRGYAVSGIASYKDYYSNALKEGYSTTDSMLFSMNKASLGVIAQLPASVDESLKEMGDMNTYGIIVGVVAFGIAALLIPMVYTILLSKSLVSEKVETGSLAFTLSTPTTRDSFIFTEACYLVFSEVVMGLSLLVGALLTREIGILVGSKDLIESLPVVHILAYALGNFMVTLAVSGICFLSSCYFNKTNQAIGTGGGLTIFFFICSILGLFGTKAIPGTIRINLMNIFNYMTIDSLFDPLAVMSGDWFMFFIKLLVLLIIALVTYVIGGLVFRKKDLPL